MPKKAFLILLFAMGALIGITAADVHAADWTIQLPNPTHLFSPGSNHAMAMGSDGSMYVAYGSKHLYMAQKAPGSEEWTIEVVDSSNQVGGYASLALDSNDHPHISYQDRDNYEVKYARYDGSSWHIEVADSPGGYAGNGTSIALDSNNRPHIVHFETYYKRLYHVHFDGTAWQRTYIAYVNAWDSYLHPSIAVDSNDRPHVVCGQYASSSDQNLRHYFFNGTSWGNEIILAGTGAMPSIAIDSYDHIHISYSGRLASPATGLGYAYYDGFTWQTDNIIAGTEWVFHTAITVDEANHPHIGYYDSSSAGGLRYAGYDGSNWQFGSVDSEQGAATAIVVDSDNRTHISSIANNELRYSSNEERKKGTASFFLKC